MGKLDVTGDLLLQKITWEWQPLEPIIEQLLPTVAPGVAMRKYHARVARRADDAGRVKAALTDTQKQESGARVVVQDRIRAQREGGHIEIETREGQRYVRFKERRAVARECPTCNHPFPQATADTPPQPPSRKPAPRPNVLYPTFPQWSEAQLAGGSSG